MFLKLLCERPEPPCWGRTKNSRIQLGQHRVVKNILSWVRDLTVSRSNERSVLNSLDHDHGFTRSTLRIFQLQSLNIAQTYSSHTKSGGQGGHMQQLVTDNTRLCTEFLWNLLWSNYDKLTISQVSSSNTLLIRLLSTTFRKIKHFLVPFSKLHFHEHAFLILSARSCLASKFSRASSKVTSEYVNRNPSVLKIIIPKSKVSLFMRNILLVGENCQWYLAWLNSTWIRGLKLS